LEAWRQHLVGEHDIITDSAYNIVQEPVAG
jgi:hypothetical protein